jgi:hypothetical protein
MEQKRLHHAFKQALLRLSKHLNQPIHDSLLLQHSAVLRNPALIRRMLGQRTKAKPLIQQTDDQRLQHRRAQDPDATRSPGAPARYRRYLCF